VARRRGRTAAGWNDGNREFYGVGDYGLLSYCGQIPGSIYRWNNQLVLGLWKRCDGNLTKPFNNLFHCRDIYSYSYRHKCTGHKHANPNTIHNGLSQACRKLHG